MTLLVFLAGCWLVYAVFQALGQAIAQIDAFGRVRFWDWVAFAFLLGWLVDLVAVVDAGLTFVRRRWQTVGSTDG